MSDMLLDEKAAQRIVEDVLGDARKLAGADAAVSLAATRSANTRFARNGITSTGDSQDTVLGVSIAFGKKRASVSTNQIDPQSLRDTVRRAAALARIAPEDPERMPLLGPQKLEASAPRYDEATASLDAGARAKAAATAIAAAKAKEVAVAGFYQTEATVSLLGNSAGLRASQAATSADLSMTARTTDGTGSGWAGRSSFRAGELDAAALAATAVDKGVRSQKPRKFEPGHYKVVLEPGAVAELLRFMIFAMNARTADEGRSFFSKQGGGSLIGERVFAESVTLTSDPADPLAPAAQYDGEGLPVGKTTWIDSGVVRNLVTSRFWAQKQGKTPLASPSLIHLHGGSAPSIDELVRGLDRGLLVTHFFYIRMLDPQTLVCTGLTRDGVFLVEKGEIVGPATNFRFNESPVKMLANAEAMTRDTWITPADSSLRVPAIRTADFNMASISEAV